MTAILITPKNNVEFNLIKEVLKKMKISSKVLDENNPYNPEFVKKIKQAEKRGSYKEINPKDIWGSLGLR